MIRTVATADGTKPEVVGQGSFASENACCLSTVSHVHKEAAVGHSHTDVIMPAALPVAVPCGFGHWPVAVPYGCGHWSVVVPCGHGLWPVAVLCGCGLWPVTVPCGHGLWPVPCGCGHWPVTVPCGQHLHWLLELQLQS